MVTILQGDELTIPITIKVNGKVVPAENVQVLRVTIGAGLIKEYPEGDIFVDGDVFQVPITQQESFRLPVGKNTIVVRPKFTGGGVRGWLGQGAINVQSSTDKVVL